MTDPTPTISTSSSAPPGRAAGCTVTDLAGDPAPAEWTSLLVAHAERHGELLACLRAAG